VCTLQLIFSIVQLKCDEEMEMQSQ